MLVCERLLEALRKLPTNAGPPIVGYLGFLAPQARNSEDKAKLEDKIKVISSDLKDYVCDPINALDTLVSAVTIYRKQLKANDSHRYLTDLNAFFNIPQEAEDIREYIERYVYSIDVSRQPQNIEPAAQASKNLSSVTRLEK